MRFSMTLLLLAAASSPVVAATINATTYGLNSTNTTGNAAAINAAINAASAGDTVLLPTGTFQLDSAVNLKTGVTLSGAGLSSTTLTYDGKSATDMIDIHSANNVQLTGFTLNGNSSTNAEQGISASNCTGLNIHSISVANLVLNSDFGPHGIYCTSSVTNSTFTNNTFNNIGVNSTWGAGIRLSYGSTNNIISNNTVTNTGRGGILLDDNSGNNIITNNSVSGSGKGPSGPGLAIEVQNCPNSLIQNNTVDHWISVDDSSGTAVRGNTVSDTSGTYKYIGIEVADTSNNVSVTHNTINGGAQVGISLSGTAKTNDYFGHNTINAANTWGIQIQGDTATSNVKNQYFYANTFSNTLSVTSGGAYANQGFGVRFNGNTSYVTFDSTIVTGNQGEAVQIGGGNVNHLTFINNSIINNDDVAIDQDPMSDVLWQGNTVNDNGPTGSWNTIPASNSQPCRLISITLPTKFTAGVPATFSAIFSEPGFPSATLGSLLWDFGDGLPATTATASHTFALPGTYEIALIEWDQTGYASHAELNITVLAAPEPASIALLLCGIPLLAKRPRRRA